MGKRSREVQIRRRARELERTGQRRHEELLLAGAVERGCLVCRQGDGGFTSVEHVFAESLGNTSYVLPKGVVCDRCNNTKLSTLDQTLVEFMPVAMRLTMLGVPSKAGKLKRLSLQNETFEHVPSTGGSSEPTLVVTPKTKNAQTVREIARHPDGRVQFNMSGTGGRRMTPRYASALSRALLKSALECAWRDRGEDVLEERFDHIRESVLGVPTNGFFALAKSSPNPNSREVSLSYDLQRWSGEWRMPVWLSVFGVLMHTDSRLPAPRPEIREEDWNILTFTTAELVRASASRPDDESAFHRS